MTFNTYLREAGIDPGIVRLVRHRDTRKKAKISLYELWRTQRRKFYFYQRLQRHKKFDEGDMLASFVVTPQGDTLFVGMYSVRSIAIAPAGTECPVIGKLDEAIDYLLYDIRRSGLLSAYIGLLSIDWGEGHRVWVQRASSQNKQVLEVRKKFSEPEFPGFTELCVNSIKLEMIPESWKAVLRKTRGVYLLVNNETGKQYVGSADGAEGLWGRWKGYENYGHGGNVELKRFKKKDRDWQITVLEVVSTTASSEDLIRIENEWKQKLKTIKFGLNLS